ncbi:hypothetical protein FHR89_000992 [Cellulomonas uda]|uniref:Uncharacterized protein n=2 Tax=Cellulomonas uda TaxID=1714 RepID=A0A4Y3KCR4_CELUD|nr:hypothetical protein [Cellulomonas uda]GEA82269.1 hypothetical protein CUD01_27130 [Cellulomonas uda]
MVAVIGVSAVIAVLMIALVGTVVFAIGQATASRSSVNAKSAAEAGLETAAAQVAGGTCWAGGSGTGSSPRWMAQVQRLVAPSADPALEGSWTNGCPVAAAPGTPPTPFRVISTGWTGTPGTGNDSGDVRTMVGQFTVVQRPPSPEFDSAIFGDVKTEAKTNLTLVGADGDIVTDHFDCSSAMDTDGGVFVNSSLSETSVLNTVCKMDGSFISKGNLSCPANGSVGGDVIVAGNVTWNTTCKVNGKMWVGGNFYCPTSGATVLGDLVVAGNVEISSACNLKGNVYIGGNLKLSNPQTWTGNVEVANGVNANSSVTITTPGTVRIKGPLTGGFTAAKVTAGTKTIPDATLVAAVGPDMSVYFPPGDPSLEFPKLTKTDARWSGWIQRKWRVDLAALKKGPYLADECDQSWISGASNFSGPLVVNTPTIYDLQQATASGGCGTSKVGLGGGLTIRLNADAVLFVTGATIKTTLRIESGDGNKHSLYLVEPWPSAKSSCTSGGGTVNGITFNTTGFSQGPNTQLMIYTPGLVNNTTGGSPMLSVTGQMYGCSVTLDTPMKLIYEPATSGGGASGRAFVVSERFRMDNQALSLAP